MAKTVSVPYAMDEEDSALILKSLTSGCGDLGTGMAVFQLHAGYTSIYMKHHANKDKEARKR